MAKLRKTARIISVAKDTATNDESSEEVSLMIMNQRRRQTHQTVRMAGGDSIEPGQGGGRAVPGPA